MTRRELLAKAAALPALQTTIVSVSHADETAPLNAIAGILHPGLIAAGFNIHRRRFSGVFGAAPEAIVSRLIMWVRSGPKRPSATVPATVWQLIQAVVSKILWPSETGPVMCAG